MELQLHAGGKKDHLTILKSYLKKQLRLLKRRKDLSDKEKAAKKEAFIKQYEKEKKDTKQNLY